MPHPAECKTRLVPPLTHEQAAALSACFLFDTAINVRAVARRCGASAAVLLTGSASAAERDEIFGCDLTYFEQRGETFGERLATGTADILAAGHHGACIIGSDSPTLPAATLEHVCIALRAPGDRVVLGPAMDGGYYLIGLKAVHATLFESIEWSTSRVFAQTLEQARAIGLEIVVLEPWYDVDDGRSLGRLRREFETGYPSGGFHAAHSRAFVEHYFNAERETAAR